MAEDADKKGLSADEKIVAEMKGRFKRCADRESTFRAWYGEDMKFLEGDSRNQYQWEDTQIRARTAAQKPALTVNKTRQACLQIINDQRQNKSQIRIRPVGDGASYAAAGVYEGIVRHIEYQSNAMETYDSAAWHQIGGGYGVWRISTDYVDDTSMDQEIFVKRIPDPLSVYLDPDIQEFDGSDARFGFVFRDMPRDEFETEYPALKDDMPSEVTLDHDRGWHDGDYVRVAEYFRRRDRADTLMHVKVPDEHPWIPGAPREGVIKASSLPKEHRDKVPDHFVQRKRAITTSDVEWFKVVGDQIVDRGTWAGRYIPLVRVIGEETVIDGKLDRKGHVRALLDPQRMLNWYASQAVEFVAGQTKTPWLVTAEAIDGLENDWNNANTESKPYLSYNGFDEQSRPTQKPERVSPPVSQPAANDGMDRAERQMMAASGQYQSQFGEQENAKSGVAIQTRQRQGDNATYHYIDHMAQAVRFTGRQLIDLIPKVYDTARVIKIMAEDGDQQEVHLDPDASAPHAQVGPDGRPMKPKEVEQAQSDPSLADKVKTIFNPTVGRYDVEADIGPSFATKRQEQFAALSQIMSQNPEAMKIAGDLLFRSADFTMADDLAERFKRTVPPAVLGTGPSLDLQQAQQHFQAQLGQAQQIIAKLTKDLADKGQDDRDRGTKAKLEDYRAETERMTALAKVFPAEFAPVVRGLVSDALGTPIVPLMAAHAAADQLMSATAGSGDPNGGLPQGAPGGTSPQSPPPGQPVPSPAGSPPPGQP